MTEEKETQTVTEQIEVAGDQLVSRVKEIVAEGNVRRLIFRAPDDKVMMEMTVTTGAVIGGVIALSAWWLAALGAIAALVARVRVEVVREVNAETATDNETPDKQKPPSTGTQKVKIQIDDDEPPTEF